MLNVVATEITYTVYDKSHLLIGPAYITVGDFALVMAAIKNISEKAYINGTAQIQIDEEFYDNIMKTWTKLTIMHKMKPRKLTIKELERLKVNVPTKHEINRVKSGIRCGHCNLSKAGKCRRCEDITRYLWSKEDNQMVISFKYDIAKITKK
jgi:hypothetical protein